LENSWSFLMLCTKERGPEIQSLATRLVSW
jgi:hypothetical protein